MEGRRTVAYVLIGIGVVTLLSQVSDGAAWLWIGLLAAAALYAYRRQRTYGFLVLGAILAGTAAGILLQELLRFDGPFLVSLGLGIAAIDVVEPRPNRWPRTLGAILAILGLLIALSSAGVFGSFWFAILLIAAGVALIARRSARPFPPSDDRRHATGTGAPSGTGPTTGPTTAATSAPTAAPTAAPHTAPTAAPPAAAPAVPTPPDARRSRDSDEARGFPAAPAGVDAAGRRRALQAWRERVAAAEARAPQSVVADDVLDAIAARAPRDLQELGEVRGMGPVRLERYGPGILEALGPTA